MRNGRLKCTSVLGGRVGGKCFVANGDNVDFFFWKNKKKQTFKKSLQI